MLDLGDPLSSDLSTMFVTDETTGALVNAGAVVATITLPDATTVTPAVTNPSTGTYTIAYTPTLAGRHGIRWVATGSNACVFTDQFDVDAAAPNGIVSLTDARGRLGKTSSATDEELRRVIDAATDFVESQIGPVVRRTVTEVLYPSSGLLLLTQAPVISLTSVAGANGYSTTYSVGTLYLDGDAGIVRPAYGGYGFTYPVTVTYVAGRAIVPALIQEAALDYIEWLWQARRGASPLPLQGEEFDSSVPMTVPNKIVQALAPYRSSVIA